MLHLPARFAGVILVFAALFVDRSWRHAHVLLIGALLAPGRRTVTSVLRITGLSRERRFVNTPPCAQPRGVVPADGRTDPARALG